MKRLAILFLGLVVSSAGSALTATEQADSIRNGFATERVTADAVLQEAAAYRDVTTASDSATVSQSSLPLNSRIDSTNASADSSAAIDPTGINTATPVASETSYWARGTHSYIVPDGVEILWITAGGGGEGGYSGGDGGSSPGGFPYKGGATTVGQLRVPGGGEGATYTNNARTACRSVSPTPDCNGPTRATGAAPTYAGKPIGGGMFNIGGQSVPYAQRSGNGAPGAGALFGGGGIGGNPSLLSPGKNGTEPSAGGGGGGGQDWLPGGGGMSGHFVVNYPLRVTSGQRITITVGAGGRGSTSGPRGDGGNGADGFAIIRW